MYTWVTGKIENVGKTSLCRVAIDAAGKMVAAAGTTAGEVAGAVDATVDKALETVPAELKTVPDQLKPGQSMDFSFLLPEGQELASGAFVDVSDQLAPCELLDQAKAMVKDVLTGEKEDELPAADETLLEKAEEAIDNVVADLPKIETEAAEEELPAAPEAKAPATETDKATISPAPKLGAGLVGVLTVAALVAAQLLL